MDMRFVPFAILVTLGCTPHDTVPPAHPTPPTSAPASSMSSSAAAAATPPASNPAVAGAGVAQAELDAYTKAKPIFEAHCAKCHAQGGAKASPKKLGHFDMTSYPFGGHHAAYVGLAVRQVLGVEGKDATMPDDDPGAIKGADLAAIVAWSRAFDASHPGAATHKDDD
jgi:mono/diheme cytochrome c family protein